MSDKRILIKVKKKKMWQEWNSNPRLFPDTYLVGNSTVSTVVPFLNNRILPTEKALLTQFPQCGHPWHRNLYLLGPTVQLWSSPATWTASWAEGWHSKRPRKSTWGFRSKWFGFDVAIASMPYRCSYYWLCELWLARVPIGRLIMVLVPGERHGMFIAKASVI